MKGRPKSNRSANKVNGIEGHQGTGSSHDARDHQKPSWY